MLSKLIDNLSVRNGDTIKEYSMIRFFILSAITLTSVNWAEAETIDVKYYGKLDLAPFVCNDITRSSFINRTCYDRLRKFLIVKLKSTSYPYCEVPASAHQAFLSAESMGRYYNANIKGSGNDGPYDCRTHTVPKY